MFEQSWNVWFDEQLEQLVVTGKVSSPAPDQINESPPADLMDDLFIATRLANLNLVHETKAKAMLRTRLAWVAMAKVPNTRSRVFPERSNHGPIHFRMSWMVGFVTVFLAIFLTAFSQPALILAQHMLGYGYLPEVGFFPLSKTQLMKGPVEFQQNQQPVVIQQGIALQRGLTGPGTTSLWLDGDPNGLNLGETWLDLAGGKQLPVQSIQRLGNNQTRLEFGALPLESPQSVLRLAGGIKIQLAWIPASEAGLASTQVSSSDLTQTPTGKVTMAPCLNVTEQLILCAKAAYVDNQGTQLLLELQPIQNGMSARGYIKMIDQAELRDAHHQSYLLGEIVPGNLNGTNGLTLQFNPIPDGITNITLHLSGIQIQQDGKEIEVAGPFDLALHLPDCREEGSPTPSVIPSSEWKPVPTPVITRRP